MKTYENNLIYKIYYFRKQKYLCYDNHYASLMGKKFEAKQLLSLIIAVT